MHTQICREAGQSRKWLVPHSFNSLLWLSWFKAAFIVNSVVLAYAFRSFLSQKLPQQLSQKTWDPKLSWRSGGRQTPNLVHFVRIIITRVLCLPDQCWKASVAPVYWPLLLTSQCILSHGYVLHYQRVGRLSVSGWRLPAHSACTLEILPNSLMLVFEAFLNTWFSYSSISPPNNIPQVTKM